MQLDVHDPDAGIEMPEEVAAPWAGTAKWFVDSHASGGATLHLRVRLFDGDQPAEPCGPNCRNCACD
ncbi:MAG: hypothetical protein R3E96_03910 [Planctomycetota bacterium]